MNYLKSKDLLQELDIKYYNRIEIKNPEELSKYNEMLENNQIVPEDVLMEEIEIVDEKQLSNLNEMVENGVSLPKDIVIKKYETSEGIPFSKYFYKNKFIFYKNEYLTPEEVDLNMMLKQTEHLAKINKNVFACKIMLIFIVTCIIASIVIGLLSFFLS